MIDARWVVEVQKELLERLNIGEDWNGFLEAQREKIEQLVAKTCAELKARGRFGLITRQQEDELRSEVLDEILGAGPIEKFLRDESVSEVMVNGPSRVYVERNGVIEETGVCFRDRTHLMKVINKLLARFGRHLDEANPLICGRMPDGSRIAADMPPVSLDGPTLNIRLFGKGLFSIEELMARGAFNQDALSILREAVRTRLNILIAGGTSTGKTTLLNALSNFIDERERIIVIEDTAELAIQKPHVIRFEARLGSTGGEGRVDIDALLRHALRKRPDRIIIGEIRGREIREFLQVCNTGHPGTMATIHAGVTSIAAGARDTAEDAMWRLSHLLRLYDKVSAQAASEETARAVQMVVALERLGSGRRIVRSIAEVLGVEGGHFRMRTLWTHALARSSC